MDMERTGVKAMSEADVAEAEKERLAAKAVEDAGEQLKELGKLNELTKFLINLVNAIMAALGLKYRVLGGAWKPPAPKDLAKMAAADEEQRQALDDPREVLRVARRIQLGASLDQARLSEPVIGALLTASKTELAAVIRSDCDDIGRWTAVARGEAAPDRKAQVVPEPEAAPAPGMKIRRLKRREPEEEAAGLSPAR